MGKSVWRSEGEAMMGELWKEGDSGGVLGGEGRGVNTKGWVWVGLDFIGISYGEEERMLSGDGFGWEWNPMRCVWDGMGVVWYLSMML